MPSRFDGKVVVITGAAGGIGRATALRLAHEGARLVLVDVAAEPLKATLAAVEATGVRAVAVPADVTRESEVRRYVDAGIQTFGGIDRLFNNAGVLGAVSPLVDYPEDTFDRVLAVNVKAVWLGMKVAAPAIAARGGGAIVNTASVAGLRGTVNLIAYTASKHAVVGMTRTAALELVRRGIRVNAICPAPIQTAMGDALDAGFRPTDPSGFHERMSAAIPMRRYGTPDEVAALAVFLLGEDAAYITGGIYTVDGGVMA